MLIVQDRRAAEQAIEHAFAQLRGAFDAGREITRSSLLRQVYLAAAESPRSVVPMPSSPVNSLPEAERRTLVLCLNAVPCSDLARLESIPTREVMLLLQRAFTRIQALRRPRQ